MHLPSLPEHKACAYALQAPAAPRRLSFERDLAKFTGRQMEAVRALFSGLKKFVLYGGALGGGKSYFLRWYAVMRLLYLFKVWHLRGVAGMICCENYPTLKDRQLSKIGREFPRWLGRMCQDHKEWGRCFILADKYGGGIICFRNLDDPSKYASSEYAFILVDELTKNELETFTHLRTRLRWPGLPDVECQLVGATNPGSIGHAWVKQLWMDRDFPAEFIRPVDYRGQFAYIKSLASDNPNLDESYWAMLNTLPENLRKAFRDGDWNIFLGQAFPQFSRQIHVVAPIPVPVEAPLYWTFDWGFGKPFSIGWWWADNDGRVRRFSEWYGWSGQANQGLRLEDSAIARGILEREKTLGIEGRAIDRLAGPDCWAKKPNYDGGGQGPSTAEVFASSPYNIIMRKGDPTRALKIRQFRERIRVPERALGDMGPVAAMLHLEPCVDDALGHVWRNQEGSMFDRDEVRILAKAAGLQLPQDGRQELPMLLVESTCEQFIRTISNLTMDDHNIEDVDTDGEDHPYDEACHICMARPMNMADPAPPPRSMAQRDYDLVTGADHATEDTYTDADDISFGLEEDDDVYGS